MPMNRTELIDAIIDDGIHEVEANYLRPDQKAKREGAIAGFNECRGKTDQQLLGLWATAKTTAKSAYSTEKAFGGKDYWYHRYYEMQVEWVLNVLSAALYNEGLETLIPVTARGMNKAMNILGVKTTA